MPAPPTTSGAGLGADLLYHVFSSAEAEFLDAIQTKVLKVFLLAMHSHLYSFALIFICFSFQLTQHLTYFYGSQLLYTVKEKGGKPNRKPYPLPYGLRNPHRNPKV